MVTYNFEDMDIKQLIWELSIRIKAIEERLSEIDQIPVLEEKVRELQKLAIRSGISIE